MIYNLNKQKILQDMVIIVDTREQKNQHLLDYFTKENIPYKVEKLDVADYSFILPNYPELNLDKKFVVEKKNSLTELAGNFTKNRDRFKREFDRAKVNNQKVNLLIETATWKKLLNGTYRSQFPPKSFMASLLTWSIRNNCPTWFCEKSEAGHLIYNILYYELYEELNKILDK